MACSDSPRARESSKRKFHKVQQLSPTRGCRQFHLLGVLGFSYGINRKLHLMQTATEQDIHEDEVNVLFGKNTAVQ